MRELLIFLLVSGVIVVFCQEDAEFGNPETELRIVWKWAPPFSSDPVELPKTIPKRPILTRHLQLWEDKDYFDQHYLRRDNAGVHLPRPTLSRHKEFEDEADRARFHQAQVPRFVEFENKYTGAQNYQRQCPKRPYMPCVSKPEANSRARRCCEQNANVPTDCYKYCHLDISLGQLHNAIMRNECPYDALQEFLSCLSERKDLRKCCEDKGVMKHGRQICGGFCAPSSGGLPPWNHDLLKCRGQFGKIRECFHAGMNPIHYREK